MRMADQMRTSRKLSSILCLFGLLAFSACSKPGTTDEASVADHIESGMAFFHGSLDGALALARKQDKKVFLDIYTDWCGPCIVMQETVFPLPEVGAYFNERFVNYKLDAEDETVLGPEIAARFDVRSYPTYLILDSDGTEISRATSAMSGEQFIALASQILGETESQFETLAARFDEGDRSPDFVQTYLDAAIVASSQSTMDAEFDFPAFAELKKTAGEYFSSRDYSVLINETDARLITTYWDKVPRGDNLVEYVIDHYDAFLAVSSAAAMSQFALGATWYAALDAASRGDAGYEAYLNELNRQPLSKAVAYDLERDPESVLDPQRMRSVILMRYLVASEHWTAVAQEWEERIAAASKSVSARMLVSAAGDLGQSTEDEHLEMALQYASRAYELDSSDLWVVISYGSELKRSGQHEQAQQVISEFRASLGDSPENQRRLEILQKVSSQESG